MQEEVNEDSTKEECEDDEDDLGALLDDMEASDSDRDEEKEESEEEA